MRIHEKGKGVELGLVSSFIRRTFVGYRVDTDF